MGENNDDRRPFEVGGDSSVPVGPGHAEGSFDPTRLDFGHYAGQTIEELAERDPDYPLSRRDRARPGTAAHHLRALTSTSRALAHPRSRR
jgi:hypothetical protein